MSIQKDVNLSISVKNSVSDLRTTMSEVLNLQQAAIYHQSCFENRVPLTSGAVGMATIVLACASFARATSRTRPTHNVIQIFIRTAFGSQIKWTFNLITQVLVVHLSKAKRRCWLRPRSYEQ
jgi:hypothetical protein